MVSSTNDRQKLFWSEGLPDITKVVSTGAFWQNILSLELSAEQVQPPSLETINQLLSLIRDVELGGVPAALSVPLQTTAREMLIVKFEVYLIVDEQVKGCVTLMSRTDGYISVLTLIEQLLDERMGGVMITNQDHEVIFVNHTLCQQHNVSAITALGQNITNISLFHQNNAHLEVFKQTIRSCRKWQGAMATRSKESKTMIEIVNVRKIQLAHSQHVYIYSFTADTDAQPTPLFSSCDLAITEQVLDETSFRIKAQALSRRGGKFIILSFQPNFYSELEETSRNKVLLALSHFHDKESFGYLGNNTFVVIIRIRNTDGKDLSTINLSIRQFFSGLKTYLDGHLVNDISEGKVGVALYGLNNNSVDEVISQSVQAMFVHEVGKSNINYYDEALVKANIRRKCLERLLIEAIKSKEIDVNFQPIVDTQSGEVTKLEALCRFRFEDVKYSVQEVIYIAEELRVISELDLIVAKRAIEEFLIIQHSSLQPLSLSLNCSLVESGEYSAHLCDLFEFIDHSSIDNELVTIEITETAYFINNTQNANLIKTIRSAGVKVAVDDFGTGNASFSYFSDFDFDELKIDKKFISNIDEVKQKYFAVNMLRQLSHDLNIKVVAEGVEKESELAVLKAIGVDYIQGYLFYQPMTPAQVGVLMAQSTAGSSV
ncbi:EAL domain-containing protein [Vibrio sp. E150_011]